MAAGSLYFNPPRLELPIIVNPSINISTLREPADNTKDHVRSILGMNIKPNLATTEANKDFIITISLIVSTILVSLGLALAAVFTGGLILGICAAVVFIAGAIASGYFSKNAFCPEEQEKINSIASSTFSFDQKSLREIFTQPIKDLVPEDPLAVVIPNMEDRVIAYCNLLQIEERLLAVQQNGLQCYEQLYSRYEQNLSQLNVWRTQVIKNLPDANSKQRFDDTFTARKAELSNLKMQKASQIDQFVKTSFIHLAGLFDRFFPNLRTPQDDSNLLKKALDKIKAIELVDDKSIEPPENKWPEIWENITDGMTERFTVLPKLLLPMLLLNTSATQTGIICHLASLDLYKGNPQQVPVDLTHIQHLLFSLSNDDLSELFNALANKGASDVTKPIIKTAYILISDIAHPLQFLVPFWTAIDQVFPISVE